MKKKFTMAAMSLMILAVSCKKDDDKHPIEGTWYWEKTIERDEVITLNDCEKKTYHTFFSNGKVEGVQYDNKKGYCEGYKYEETYTISGDTLIFKGIDDEGRAYENPFIFSINGNVLSLKEAETKKYTSFHIKRQ